MESFESDSSTGKDIVSENGQKNERTSQCGGSQSELHRIETELQDDLQTPDFGQRSQDKGEKSLVSISTITEEEEDKIDLEDIKNPLAAIQSFPLQDENEKEQAQLDPSQEMTFLPQFLDNSLCIQDSTQEVEKDNESQRVQEEPQPILPPKKKAQYLPNKRISPNEGLIILSEGLQPIIPQKNKGSQYWPDQEPKFPLENPKKFPEERKLSVHLRNRQETSRRELPDIAFVKLKKPKLSSVPEVINRDGKIFIRLKKKVTFKLTNSQKQNEDKKNHG